MKSLALQAETLYTSEEVSEYLHISLRTVQRMLQAGTLKSYRIHGQYRIKGLDLLGYLDGVRQDADLPDEPDRPVEILDLIGVSPIAVEVDPALVDLLRPESNPAFAPALQALRKHISLELGFVMPGLRLQDSDKLSGGQYRICIQGQPVARGELSDTSLESQEGLLKHLDTVVRQFAHEILSREEVSVMIERLRQQHSVVVEEVLGLDAAQGKLTIGQLTRILRALLAEQVSIRNLPLILEILADTLEAPVSPEQLVEKLRQGLARQLCSPLADSEGVIEVLGFEPGAEQILQQALEQQDVRLSQLSASLHQQLRQQPAGLKVLLCGVALRPRLSELLRRHFGDWQILAYQEIDRHHRVKLIASIDF